MRDNIRGRGKQESLRILTLSNLYPPHYIGGYELGCRDVMEALIRRGHEVTVLTSTFGLDEETVEGYIYRQLRHQFSPVNPQGRIHILRAETHNMRTVRSLLRTVQPHIVTVWNMANVSHYPILSLARSGFPIVYLISDYWMIESHDRLLTLWKHVCFGLSTRRVGRLTQAILRRLWLRGDPPRWQDVNLRTALFTSNALRRHYADAGFRVSQSPVIHWGTHIPPQRGDVLDNTTTKRESKWRFKILYVGQIVPHKGIDTIIEAVSLLQGQNGIDVYLTIVGGGLDQPYQDTIKQTVRQKGLQKVVRFVGKLERRDLKSYYHTHDALVFPSKWDEPFSITLLEAMAHSIPIVSTLTGGSKELLKDGETCVAFPPGDAAYLASLLFRLAVDADLRQSLRERAYEQVSERFSLESMAGKVETFLLQTKAENSRHCVQS